MAGTPTARSTRTLVVVRHAKAEREGPTDFDRELAPRGHGDAADAARWLVRQEVAPTHALVSSARRTEQTWEVLAGTAGWTVEAHSSRRLYLADEEVALGLVRDTDPDAQVLVVVGHNPTMHSLVVWLDDGRGDATARAAIASAYPTSGVGVLSVEGDWADLGPSGATLRGFHVGRG